MSWRDVLFHWEGLTKVHLLRTLHRRPSDLRGVLMIPACAARSDRRGFALWESDAAGPDELHPCRQCATTVERACNYLTFLRRHQGAHG